ncbi:MAG: hypothetical protein N2D54_06305 [Chloroflexota bacterium]
MTSNFLYRISGYAALLASVFLLITGLGLMSKSPEISGFMAFSILGAVAHVLFIFIAMGFYFRQAEQLGWLGLVGFVTITIGNLIFTAGQYISAYISLSDNPFGVGITLLPLGLLIFALINDKAGDHPRLAAWLMFFGPALNLFSSYSDAFSSPVLLQILLFSAGLILTGLFLVKKYS